MAALIRGLGNKLLACGCKTVSMAAMKNMHKWSHGALQIQRTLRIPAKRTVLPQISNSLASSKKLSTLCPYRKFSNIRSSMSNPSFRRGPSLASLSSVRRMSQSAQDVRNKTTLIYVCAAGVVMLGMAYAGVPLYRIFCQATGRGGQAVVGEVDKVETMEAVKDRIIRIRFNADTASSMQWNFRPQQTEVRVLPGETALAFYSAKNPTNKPIVGISTYNVVPFEAGQYFNKIQCFCFEEQRLNPHEQVDMPVFFYIDPEFADDPKMENVDLITLSYTFFEAKDGMSLPLPGYMQAQSQPLASTS